MIINDRDNYEKVKNSISMDNLRNIIKSKGYTTTKVAMESKVSESTINAYINGQKLPSVTSLISMSEFLKCNSDYLLGRTNNPMKIDDIEKLHTNEELMLLFQNISSLPEEKQALVSAYVKGLMNS